MQQIILEAGTGPSESAALELTADQDLVVGIFAPNGTSLAGAMLNVMMETPGSVICVGTLTSSAPATRIPGPGTFKLARNARSSACGAFKVV